MLKVLAAFSRVTSADPCLFNPMCSCRLALDSNKTQDNVRDVSCVGVPFSRLPDLPGGGTSHVDIIGGGLEFVDSDSLGSAQLLTVRLISNSIVSLSPRAFMSASKTVRSIDLGYNALQIIPFPSLSQLTSLEWLNLHGNSITSSEGDWGGLTKSLTNLYLSSNDLVKLNLAELRRLAWLNADGNLLEEIETGTLPGGLQTLSLSSNRLTVFPTELIEEVKRLSWLYLRDNFIKKIPFHNFKHRKKLEKLDLGENGIRVWQSDPFNGTLIVRDLNLDLNELRVLGPGSFRGMNLGRIYLTQNALEEIHEEAFVSLENTLEYLDLGHNMLQEVPKALSSLKKLKYLYLPSNRISRIANESFDSFSRTLDVLSFLGNKLENIPSDVLRGCRKLSHLNIGYNHIMEIIEEDFEQWGESLDTLLLMNNRLVQLNAHTFRQTPRLRELSLSFNKISSVDPDTFVDVANSLESLEISFGLYQEEFPEEFLKPLKSLVWLALDNNSFRTISITALYSFRNLQYLNLDGNRLSTIPVGLFQPSVHRALRDVRISNNHIMSIDPHTFSNLPEIQSIVLTGNQIRILKPNAFRSIQSKLTVILSDNKMNTISPRAFNDIATLVRLDLQSNQLQEFSLSAFHNVTAPYLPLNLNLSRNEISNLLAADTLRPVCIHTIDISHNKIPTVPKEFFEAINNSVKRINLGYNHITKLDETPFGNLRKLFALTLHHNSIVTLRKRAFVGLSNLQILDLSHNHIEQIHMEQFKCLPHLRVADLSYNHIRSIPKDAFQNTKLERLDLSNNEIVTAPVAALGEVGFTLRVLDFSHNQIEHVDSTMFPETPHLTTLRLAYNKLSLIADNVFTSVSGLLSLDLSGNRLKANWKELFHSLESLRHLNLADAGLQDIPPLPLPNLASLNFSGNSLQSLQSDSFASLPHLRSLDLSRCRLTAVQPIWQRLPYIKHLDLTYNPIKGLSKESFYGLKRVEQLNLNGLDRLEKIQDDFLSNCPSLRSLRLQTWSQLQSLRLDKIVTYVPGLRRLSVFVSTPSPPAGLGIIAPKLRHLEITGPRLRVLPGGTLRGLRPGPDLVLQIRGTSLEEPPMGLLSALGRIHHLSLDLRDNRLNSLSPDIFYFNLTSWEDVGTKLISGGLMLDGNPWTCDCSLVWVGHWLRRWLRESLQLHRTAPDPQLMEAVRVAVCSDPRTDRTTPLVDLHPETLSCHASALSGSGGIPLTALWALLVFLTPTVILLK